MVQRTCDGMELCQACWRDNIADNEASFAREGKGFDMSSDVAGSIGPGGGVTLMDSRQVWGRHGTFDHREISASRPSGSDTPGDPEYRVRVYKSGHTGEPVQFETLLTFQHGPIKECGLNGLTNEDLLIIVADRLRSFQESRFACAENADALGSVEDALASLEARTVRRMQEGVEGTHSPDKTVANPYSVRKPARPGRAFEVIGPTGLLHDSFTHEADANSCCRLANAAFAAGRAAGAA